MSKHFFYDYKVELEEQLGKKFRRELKQLEEERAFQTQLDEAQQVIETYFKVLESSLSDIILISDNKVQLIREGSMIVQFKMFDNYVKFTRFDHAIEVEIGDFDRQTKIIEARIISNIIPGEKRCVVKRIGKVHDGAHFDDKTINFYMNEAFGHLEEMK
jgi:hypothetical protein